MIMPFEGTHYESTEDAASIVLAWEPTHSDDDEAYYIDVILPGYADEADEPDSEPDTDWSDDDWRIGQDRWERAFWGD